MYLFSRNRLVDPAQVRAAAAWAVDIAGRAGATSGIELSAWMTMLSPDYGRISVTGWVETLADYETALGKLTADTALGDAIEAGSSLFSGGTEEVLAQLVHGAPSTEPINYVQVTRTRCLNGKLGAGIAAGIELTDAAARIARINVVFTSAVTGAYGGVAWLGGFASMADLDAAHTALGASAEWVELVDRHATNYSSEGEVMIFRRLA